MQEIKFPILLIVFKQQVIVIVIVSVSVHYIKVLHILLVDSVVITVSSLSLAEYVLPIARSQEQRHRKRAWHTTKTLTAADIMNFQHMGGCVKGETNKEAKRQYWNNSTSGRSFAADVGNSSAYFGDKSGEETIATRKVKAKVKEKNGRGD